MSRLPRSKLNTFTHFHVCARGNNDQPLFFNDGDRIRYLSLIEKYQKRYDFKCLAYCLMTNHIHILFLCPSVQKLSQAMHSIQVAYAVYFNRRHQRRGHLFEGRFTSWVIRDAAHLISTKEYIEGNPVKAEMVKTKEEYPWSSAFRDISIVTVSKIMT